MCYYTGIDFKPERRQEGKHRSCFIFCVLKIMRLQIFILQYKILLATRLNNLPDLGEWEKNTTDLTALQSPMAHYMIAFGFGVWKVSTSDLL